MVKGKIAILLASVILFYSVDATASHGPLTRPIYRLSATDLLAAPPVQAAMLGDRGNPVPVAAWKMLPRPQFFVVDDGIGMAEEVDDRFKGLFKRNHGGLNFLDFMGTNKNGKKPDTRSRQR